MIGTHNSGNAENAADYGVVKLDPDGNIIWKYSYGGTNIDRGTSIAFDLYINRQIDSGLGYIYGVLKLDSNGDILWQKESTVGGSDCGYDKDGAGNVYLNGNQNSDSFAEV